MTYQEASTLKLNQPFIDRVRVAVAKWQDYLINTGEGDPEYAEKVAEGARINYNFEVEVQKVLNALIGDTELLALQSGETVTDVQLSSICEKYIQAFSPMNTQPAALASGMTNMMGQPPVAFQQGPRMFQRAPEPKAS
jgi:hypothetical protein